MAGTSYVDYRAPLRSWVQNTNFLGIFNPGRYCGFDTLSITGATTLKIGHIQTGMIVRDYNFNALGPWGTWVTRQGVIIKEFDTLPDDGSAGFTIQPNSGNAYWRYDVLVGEHDYVPIAGQQTPPKYYVITGPTNTYATSGPALPILPNPNRQVILAIIAIPPQMSDLTSSLVRLIKMRSADTGAELDAKLGEPNTYSAIQQEKWSPDLIIGSEDNSGFWNLPNNGNSFKITASGIPQYLQIYPPNGGPPVNTNTIIGFDPIPMYGLKIEDIPIQEGTKITLKINPLVLLFDNYFPDTTGYWNNRGYRKIRFNPSLITGYYFLNGADRKVLRVPRPYNENHVILSNGGTVPNTMYPDYLGSAIMDVELINNEWWIKNITYDVSTNHTQRASYLIGDYQNSPNSSVNQDYYQPLFTPVNSTLSSVYEAYYNFSYNRAVAGVPFAYFLGSQGAIRLREWGDVEINAHALIWIDFTGLMGSAASSTVFSDVWIGPGSINMFLIVKPYTLLGSNGVGETKYLLDHRSTRDLNPRFMGAFSQDNHFPANYLFSLTGNYIVSLNPNQVAFIRFELVDPTDKITWGLKGSYKGSNCLKIKWLGQGQEYSGGLN